MYKVLIKIDGEYLYMLEAFENGSMDIVSLLVIIYCISIAYRKRYSLTGYLYVKEQLNRKRSIVGIPTSNSRS